jgi:hypothetical protein
MIFVESTEDLDAFLVQFKSKESIIIPVFTDTKAHPVANTLSLLYVRFGMEDYVLPFNHNEAINLPPEAITRLETTQRTFSPSAKALCHTLRLTRTPIDLRGLEYFATGAVTEDNKFYLPIQQAFYTKHHATPNLNRAVAIMTLVQYLRAYADMLTGLVSGYREIIDTEGFMFHNNVVIPACAFMESGGIHVDADAFTEKYGARSKRLLKNELVYTEYNPYTLAGRVSSKFGGISFTSLNKTDGTRDMFTSRFEKGAMVLIDFESFHLRLMGELTQYALPKDSLHEYFGKQYFEKDTLTPEEYEESKQITFAMLYGDQTETDIPFFRCVQQFITAMWESAQASGMFVSPTGRTIALDRIEDPSPAKLFNYLLQLREMEVGMKGIFGLIPLFMGKNSKVVLYTYDSILIDFDMSDGKQLVKDIVSTLEQDGTYPVRVYMGNSYNNVKNVTSRVKS